MRLELLGGLRLVDANGTALAVQRRRLALLAILAVAGRRGVRRERLLALLWPDAPEASARHALDQALSALRRQLGSECFVRSDAVALNPAVVQVDLWEFQDALDAGGGGAALARYGGPLLDGFHLDDSPDFSHWLDAERAHLAERHAVALAALGDAALARGDGRDAVALWRAYQRIDPLSARGALGLIRALSATSDRAAALQFGRSYEALVRSELDCAPDPAVRAALAAAAITQDVPPVAVVSPPMAGAPEPREAPATSSAVSAAVEVSAAAPSPTRPRRAWWLAVAFALVAIATTYGAVRVRGSRPVEARSRAAVVFPFRVADTTGDLAYLSEAMVDLLALKFAGGDELPVVPPGAAMRAWRAAGIPADGAADARLQAVARKLGAGRIVTGSVIGDGMSLLMTAAVTDASSGRVILDLEARGRRDSVPALVNRLAANLLLMVTTAAPRDLPDLGGAPIAALRAYAAGEAAARDGRFEDAIRELRSALDRDSTFALAALRLADVAEWVGPSWTWNPPEVKREALRLAWANRQRLSTPDRALLVAVAGPDYPVPSTEVAHLDAWSRAVSLAPQRAEAWFGLGDYLFHSGPLIGRADAHRRAREAFSRAAALDSGRVAALGHLADLDAVSGDTAHLRRVAGAYLRLSPSSELADFVRWRLAVGTGDSAQLAALRTRWDRMPLESLMRIATAMQSDALRLDELGGIAAALDRRLYEAADAQQVNELLVDLELNQGRPEAAARRTRAWRERVSADRIAVRLAGDALLAGGDRAAARAALDQLGSGDARQPGVRCARALLDATTVPSRAEPARRELERLAAQRRPDDSLGLSAKNALCALVAGVLGGDSGSSGLRKLRQLDSAMQTGPPSFDVTMSGGENLLLAAAWARHGRTAEALAAVRRRAYGGLWPTRFLSDALREEGFLAAAVGDTLGAERAWRHYLALRTRVEPVLEGERERVRLALASLRAR